MRLENAKKKGERELKRKTVFYITVAFIACLLMNSTMFYVPAAVGNVDTQEFTVPSGRLSEKLMREVKQAITSGEADKTFRILISTFGHDYQSVVKAIEANGGTVLREFKYVKGLCAEISARGILSVASSPEIRMMYLDELIQFPEAKINEMKIEILANLPEKYRRNLPFNTYDISTPEIHKDIQVVAIENVETILETITPCTYDTFVSTHALELWEMGYYGQDTIVAVLDIGVYPYHPMIYGNVIGGISFVDPEIDPAPWDDVGAGHGTYCASQICGHAVVMMPEFYAEVWEMYGVPVIWGPAWIDDIYVPEGYGAFFCFGQAPMASIYAVKVLCLEGWGYWDWAIAGIEHCIELRETGVLDIDILSMSFGGWYFNDGRDMTSEALDAASEAGITSCVSAGNDGPGFGTASAPGVARTAIAVGGTYDPLHLKVYYEWYYRAYYGVPGYGDYLVRFNHTGISYMSSRGNTKDGRLYPAVSALCLRNFAAYPPYYMAWWGGTSFACPLVSGAAALLYNYWNNLTGEDPERWRVKAAIYKGADWLEGFEKWEQGGGHLNVKAAADLMFSVCWLDLFELEVKTCPPETVEFGCDGIADFYHEDFKIQHFNHYIIKIRDEHDLIRGKFDFKSEYPGWNYYWIYITAPSARGPYERGYYQGFGLIIDDEPYDYAEIYTTDGDWFEPAFAIWNDYAYAMPAYPFMDGLYDIVIENDILNWGITNYTAHLELVKAEVYAVNRAVAVCGYGPGGVIDVYGYEGIYKTIRGKISEGEWKNYTFEVPEGATSVLVKLEWKHDWRDGWFHSQPITDLDLYVYNALGYLEAWPNPAGTDEPEYVYEDWPSWVTPGTWTLNIYAFRVPYNYERFTVTIQIRIGEPVYLGSVNITETPFAFFCTPTKYDIIVGYMLAEPLPVGTPATITYFEISSKRWVKCGWRPWL